MTPDPLPVALPELKALDKPWRAWSGRINGKFAEVLVYNAEYIQAREAQMQAALRAQAEEVERLLKQALEALEHHREQTRPIHRTDAVIETLRTALAGRQQL